MTLARSLFGLTIALLAFPRAGNGQQESGPCIAIPTGVPLYELRTCSSGSGPATIVGQRIHANGDLRDEVVWTGPFDDGMLKRRQLAEAAHAAPRPRCLIKVQPLYVNDSGVYQWNAAPKAVGQAWAGMETSIPRVCGTRDAEQADVLLVWSKGSISRPVRVLIPTTETTTLTGNAFGVIDSAPFSLGFNGSSSTTKLQSVERTKTREFITVALIPLVRRNGTFTLDSAIGSVTKYAGLTWSGAEKAAFFDAFRLVNQMYGPLVPAK